MSYNPNKNMSWEEFLRWNTNSFGQPIPDYDDLFELDPGPNATQQQQDAAFEQAKARKLGKLRREWEQLQRGQ